MAQSLFQIVKWPKMPSHRWANTCAIIRSCYWYILIRRRSCNVGTGWRFNGRVVLSWIARQIEIVMQMRYSSSFSSTVIPLHSIPSRAPNPFHLLNHFCTSSHLSILCLCEGEGFVIWEKIACEFKNIFDHFFTFQIWEFCMFHLYFFTKVEAG